MKTDGVSKSFFKPHSISFTESIDRSSHSGRPQ